MSGATATKLHVPMKARFTAAADDGDSNPGSFRALVSAYGVKYRIGWALWHTIEMGAFKASIDAQESIPIFWMHAWDWSEQMPIGVSQAEESADEGGLVLDGRMFVDIDPSIARLYEAMRAGAIREWSIGYAVLASRADREDDMHQFVTEAELLEGSSVLRGANPETKTLETARASGMTRVTTSSGVVVETADSELVARLAGTTNPTAPTTEPTETETFDTSHLLGRSKVREMFGSTALADDTTNP